MQSAAYRPFTFMPHHLKHWRAIQKKVAKSLQVRGFLGTLAFCATSIARLARKMSPESRRVQMRKSAAGEEFDRRYGVDTGGIIPLSNLQVTDTNWIHGVAYEGVTPADFERVLRELALPYDDFTFIDLGCGKGRAVLLASAIPFRKVVGVELSEELTRIAEENVRRWPRDQTRCDAVELTAMDAGEYRFPEGPFVLFMYNPFERPVMEQVVANVTAAFRRNTRRIVVVYFTPKHEDAWKPVPFLRRVVAQPGYQVYDTI